MRKIRINYATLFFLAVVAVVVTMLSTRYDYGSNIFGRYCRGNDFYTKPVCIEATQKRMKSLQSEEFKAQDYYYLSVTLPVTKYSYDFKNPTFSGSITFSQFGYAMSNPHFYIDALIIFAGLFLLYLLLFRLPFIPTLFRK